jgi:hypothetical protein
LSGRSGEPAGSGSAESLRSSVSALSERGAESAAGRAAGLRDLRTSPERLQTAPWRLDGRRTASDGALGAPGASDVSLRGRAGARDALDASAARVRSEAFGRSAAPDAVLRSLESRSAAAGASASLEDARGRRALPGGMLRERTAAGREAAPSVSDAQAIESSGRRGGPTGLSKKDFYDADHRRHHDGHHDHHGGHHHHDHDWDDDDFFFGVYLGFGYPYYYPYGYWGYRYPYYGYPYYSLYVGYPYVGYYSYYDYPYLNDYGCDFYSGYYVRFGDVGASYYLSCSHLGLHAHPDHHVHTDTCSLHGAHHYHVRDCSICFPTGGVAYETHDAAGAGAAPAQEAAPAAQVAESSAQPGISEVPSPGLQPAPAAAPEPPSPDAVAARRGPSDPLAQLSPAKQTLALGLLAFRRGEYDDAAELLYNASIEDPDSGVVRVALAASLVAIAEYGYGAAYLRQAYRGSDPVVKHPLQLRRLYGADRQAEFEAHRRLLADRAELFPSDPDTLLLSAFVALGTGEKQAALVSLNALEQIAQDPGDRELAARLRAASLPEAAVEAADAAPSPAPSSAASDSSEAVIRAFLESPGLETVKALPVR